MTNKKKSTKEILNFYQDKDIVSVYDTERFSGFGGKYLDAIETNSISKFITSGSVLELGPGTGRLTVILKRNKSVELTCLDSSSEMLKKLIKKVKVDGMVNQSVFEKINISKKFDFITALRFFDHFSMLDQDRILKNISPKLKKNGNIVYSCLSRHSSEGFLSRFFYFSKTNYFYSYEEYLKLFKKNKLRVVSFSSAFILPRGVYLRLKSNTVLFKIVKFIDESMTTIFSKNGSLYTFVLEAK